MDGRGLAPARLRRAGDGRAARPDERPRPDVVDLKERFARPVLWLAAALVVGANVFNIGADLGSMAEAFRLLIPLPFAVLVVGFAGAILLLEVFVSYDRYSLILRWLALSIFAYVIELFVVDVNWSQVLAGLVPSFQPTLESVEALVAISAPRSRRTCSSGRPRRRSRSARPGGSTGSTPARSARCASTSCPACRRACS